MTLTELTPGKKIKVIEIALIVGGTRNNEAKEKTIETFCMTPNSFGYRVITFKGSKVSYCVISNCEVVKGFRAMGRGKNYDLAK